MILKSTHKANPYTSAVRFERTATGRCQKEGSFMHKKYAIHHPELVAIESDEGKICFGGKEEWLDRIGRGNLRGGAITAAELLSYLAATRSTLHDFYPPLTQRSQQEFMGMVNEVIDFFVPSRDRQLSLAAFVEGVTAFANHSGHHLEVTALDIPDDVTKRPSADRCLGFIDDAMEKDAPVAFLRRTVDGDGSVNCQWRLIVERMGNYVVLADNGLQGKLEFRLWYDTARLGGALVFAARHPLS